MVFGNILIDDRQFDTPFKDGASYKFGEAFAGQRNMLEASTFLSKDDCNCCLVLVLNVAFFEIKTETSIGVNCLSMLEYFSYLHLNYWCCQVVVSVNRFYPTISRYWTFIKVQPQSILSLESQERVKIKTKKG